MVPKRLNREVWEIVGWPRFEIITASGRLVFHRNFGTAYQRLAQ